VSALLQQAADVAFAPFIGCTALGVIFALALGSILKLEAPE
jgi:hypothetical protein